MYQKINEVTKNFINIKLKPKLFYFNAVFGIYTRIKYILFMFYKLRTAFSCSLTSLVLTVFISDSFK